MILHTNIPLPNKKKTKLKYLQAFKIRDLELKAKFKA